MDYEIDLKERIEKFEERINLDSDLLLSIYAITKKEEKFDAFEAECDLSYYKELIEGVTLIRLYNGLFFDPELKEKQKKYEELLKKVEKYHKAKVEVLTKILNTIFKPK